jgi:general secretion pathway protein D
MTNFSPRLFVFVCVCAAPLAVQAQYPGVQGSVESHIQVLEQKRAYCADLVKKGNAAIADNDYESAYALFKSAVDTLPQGGEASADIRKQALGGFCNAAVLLARQRISEGRYADARSTVEVVLENRYDPDYAPAKSLRSKLMDPQGFSDRGTITPAMSRISRRSSVSFKKARDTTPQVAMISLSNAASRP